MNQRLVERKSLISLSINKFKAYTALLDFHKAKSRTKKVSRTKYNELKDIP